MGVSVAEAVRAGRAVAAERIPPPEPTTDVCPLCRGWRRAGYALCFPCALTSRQVSRPCSRVAVMSLYRPRTSLHRLLRNYKDGGPRSRVALAARVGALAQSFIWREGPTFAPDGWDAVVVVPSSTGRPGAHPLEAALSSSTWLGPQVLAGALRAAHRGETDHCQASDSAFVADPTVEGRSILLVDDTWTTGARAQSAASALAGAGAQVVAIAVLGRALSPTPGAASGAWWARYAGRPGVVAGPVPVSVVQEKRETSPMRRESDAGRLVIHNST